MIVGLIIVGVFVYFLGEGSFGIGWILVIIKVGYDLIMECEDLWLDVY